MGSYGETKSQWSPGYLKCWLQCYGKAGPEVADRYRIAVVKCLVKRLKRQILKISKRSEIIRM
jgi:hypothetical protein